MKINDFMHIVQKNVNPNNRLYVVKISMYIYFLKFKLKPIFIFIGLNLKCIVLQTAKDTVIFIFLTRFVLFNSTM